MKNILLAALLFTCSFASGQLEIRLNSNSGYTSENIIKIEFSITNHFAVDTSFHWTFETLPEQPTQWRVGYIYDVILCYAEGFRNSICEDDYSNSLQSDSTITYSQLGIYTEDDFVEGCVTLHLLSDCVEEPHDTLVSYNFKFDKDWPTRIEELTDLPKVELYPNPSQHQFFLTNDGQVSSFLIYTIDGDLVEERRHILGSAHDISALASGPYFIVLRNMGGEAISTLRFLKVE